MRRVYIMALAALLLGSCSSGPSTSVHVIMTDFQFTPSSYTVPAGQRISIQLTNNGAATHSFIIMKAGSNVQGHFTDADKSNVYWEESAVPAGQSVATDFTAPNEPGNYQVVCGVPGHFESGMVANLVVVKSP